MVVVCPAGAEDETGAGTAPNANDGVVVVEACAPKSGTDVVAGAPKDSGIVDVAVLPKVDELTVAAGAEMSLK